MHLSNLLIVFVQDADIFPESASYCSIYVEGMTLPQDWQKPVKVSAWGTSSFYHPLVLRQALDIDKARFLLITLDTKYSGV